MKLDIRKFITSMVVSLIIIFGVIGFIVVDLSSINGTLAASSSSDVAIVKEEHQLSEVQRVANKYLFYWQKFWVADNPVIRLGRQVFYIADLYMNSFEDFEQIYRVIDKKQRAQIRFG